MSHQFQRMELVVIEGTQVGDAVLNQACRQPINPREEIETILEAIGIELDMTEMRDIETGLSHAVAPDALICTLQFASSSPPATAQLGLRLSANLWRTTSRRQFRSPDRV